MSEKIRFGMIGCGGNGRGHLECAKEVPELELLATCDVREEQAKTYAEEFGAAHWTTDWQELLQYDDLDAVLISVPHTLHLEVAVGSCEAGKHVFIEKPMALSVADANAMVAAAEKNDVKFMVGQVLRFRKVNAELKRIIASGDLGEVRNLMRRRFSSSRTFGGPEWYTRPGESFVLFNFGSHEVDIMLWVLDAVAESVFAQGVVVNPDLNDYDDLAIQMKFSTGAIGCFEMSKSAVRGAWDMHVIGTKKSIYADQNKIVLDGEEIDVTYPKRADRIAELAEFAAAILEDREPEASGRNVLRTIQTLEAAQISIEEGRIVTPGK